MKQKSNFRVIRVFEIISWALLPFVLLAIILQITQNDISITFKQVDGVDHLYIFTNFDEDDQRALAEVAVFYEYLFPNGEPGEPLTSGGYPSNIESLGVDIVLNTSNHTYANIGEQYGYTQEQLNQILNSGTFVLKRDWPISVASATIYISPQISYDANGNLILIEDANFEDDLALYDFNKYFAKMEMTDLHLTIPEKTIVNFTVDSTKDGDIVKFALEPDRKAVPVLALTGIAHGDSALDTSLFVTFFINCDYDGVYNAGFRYSDQPLSSEIDPVVSGSYDLGIQTTTIDPANPIPFRLPYFHVGKVFNSLQAGMLTFLFVLVLVMIGTQIYLVRSYREGNRSDDRFAEGKEGFTDITQDFLTYKTIISWIGAFIFGLISITFLILTPVILSYFQTGVLDIPESLPFAYLISFIALMLEMVMFMTIAIIYSIWLAHRSRIKRVRMQTNKNGVPNYSLSDEEDRAYFDPNPGNKY